VFEFATLSWDLKVELIVVGFGGRVNPMLGESMSRFDICCDGGMSYVVVYRVIDFGASFTFHQ